MTHVTMRLVVLHHSMPTTLGVMFGVASPSAHFVMAVPKASPAHPMRSQHMGKQHEPPFLRFVETLVERYTGIS
jgi:hypothetical protein